MTRLETLYKLAGYAGPKIFNKLPAHSSKIVSKLKKPVKKFKPHNL